MDRFLSRIQNAITVRADFHQEFSESDSGMIIEENGFILAIYGHGLLVEYDDGRSYLMDSEGIKTFRDRQFEDDQLWDDRVRSNPLLWLIGISGEIPKPVIQNRVRAEFDKSEGLWERVIFSWSGKADSFPESLEVLDSDGNTNRFTFRRIRWSVSTSGTIFEKK